MLLLILLLYLFVVATFVVVAAVIVFVAVLVHAGVVLLFLLLLFWLQLLLWDILLGKRSCHLLSSPQDLLPVLGGLVGLFLFQRFYSYCIWSSLCGRVLSRAHLIHMSCGTTGPTVCRQPPHNDDHLALTCQNIWHL